MPDSNAPGPAASLDQLQQAIGYTFRDTDLLKLALRHRSAGKPNNERLEFLGDAVLGAIVAETLYRGEQKDTEGNMTVARASLVNGRTLARLGKGLAIEPLLELGRGERQSGRVRSSIIEDALEALIGAVFLDSDFDTTRIVVQGLLRDRLDTLLEREPVKDPKTELQELAQARGATLPVYTVVKTEGPAHQREFTVNCSLPFVDKITVATASSRRNAERAAAREMLAIIADSGAG